MTDSIPQYYRQEGVIPREKLQDLHINIIGVGAIGSFTALMLAKMGVGSITAWDEDTVELHNFPVQFFPNNSIGQQKVNALGNMLDMMSKCDYVGCPKHFTGQEHLKGITISAVDSIAARRDIFKHIKNNADIPLYMDTRMGAYTGQILSFNPMDRGRWSNYIREKLPSSRNVHQLPCSERSILFTVLGISSEVGSLLRRHLMGEHVPYIINREFKHTFVQTIG